MTAPTPKVIFATKTWGGDYQRFLSGEFETKTPDYNFSQKWLLINNGIPEGVKFNCGADWYIDVSKYADRALRFFGLNRDSFKRNGFDGYNYSIAEIVCMYLAQDSTLCWMQGDCRTTGDWVRPDLLKDDIVVVSPWSGVNTWHDKNNLDHFFSDQAFLLRPKDFKEFNLKEPVLKEYPAYGGASFEYKMGQYLHKSGKYRRILNEAYCIH